MSPPRNPVRFTAPVNAVMKVGSLAETVTVTGASPTVDVRNVRTQSVLNDETLNRLPSGAQNLSALFAATLSISMASIAGNPSGIDVGGSGGEMGTASVHNGRSDDMKITQEGMNTMNSRGTNGGILHFGQHYNMEAVSEVTMGSNGMTAETETAGLQINYIPKDGGNKFSISGRAAYTNESFQSNNLTPDLISRGATTPPSIKKIYDYGASGGGPIKRDHLWFFTAHRWWGTEGYPPGSFFNAAQGKKAPNGRPLYVPGDRAFATEPSQENSIRMTWQASKKDKITYYGNHGDQCLCGQGISGTLAPEAAQITTAPRNHLGQGTWTRTQSNRVLMEGGATMLVNPYVFPHFKGVGKNDIRITELSPAFTYNAFASAGLIYTDDDPNPNAQDQRNARGSVSYITGSHSLKFGGQWAHGWQAENGSNNILPGFGPVAFTVFQQVPVSVTLYNNPLKRRSDYRNMAFYAQDQWALSRLTLNLGVRADIFDGWSPDQDSPASAYVAGFHVNRIEDTPVWRDVSPRFGAAYDMKGDGKTAIKVAAGRYVAAAGAGIPQSNNPASAIATTVTRTWTDANNNFFPEGDPRNPAANGELGPSPNAAFGTPVITTFFSPDVLTKNRGYTWQLSAAVDRELRDNVRVSVSYFRTAHFNQTVIDNEAVTPASYDPYCVTAPASALLPGGGGNRICGFADISFAGRATVPRSVNKNDKDFGDVTDIYNGVDVDMNVRLARGVLVRGGFTLGRSVTDTCFVVDSPQVLYQCRVVRPNYGHSQVKFSGAYPLPYGVEVSVVYQNIPGTPIQASATFFNADVAPSLGRNLSSCPAPTGACNATVTLNLLTPNANYEGRINQVDFRVTKEFRQLGRVRATLDLYNALNASPILGRNNAFGTTGAGWGRPTTIMPGRIVKLGAQYSWN